MTPLPKPIPADLAQVKSLIDERVARIDAIDKEIDVKQGEKSSLREEISELQDAGKKMLSITPRVKIEKRDKDPKTGEKLS